mgnify:CR=1 FL=1
MRFVITGQQGFLAKNLKLTLKSKGHVVVDDDVLFTGENYKKIWTGEACVHSNSEKLWAKIFAKNEIDVVIHNAAVVGTDVVALQPEEALLTNVHGTVNIVRAANEAGVGVCYFGTTVVYDTVHYQHTTIYESSDKAPQTYYGIQKLAGENAVIAFAKKWSVVRPLFAYGGLGDMNSLISKVLFANKDGRGSVDVFLDPTKKKDYLHASDYCAAVEAVCSSEDGWMTDWNVSAETPLTTGEIVEKMSSISGVDLSRIVCWHPETDYLGNHILSSEKIRERLGWRPSMSLESGVRDTLQWIKESSGYNPLVYLDAAKRGNVDLLKHFPSR